VIAGFNPSQRRATRERALGHYRRGQAAAAPGVANIEPELAKRPADA